MFVGQVLFARVHFEAYTILMYRAYLMINILVFLTSEFTNFWMKLLLKSWNHFLFVRKIIHTVYFTTKQLLFIFYSYLTVNLLNVLYKLG